MPSQTIKIEPSVNSELDGAVMSEKIDIKVLNYLINSDLLKPTFNNPIALQKFANEKEQLIKYKRLVKNGHANVEYNKVKSMGGFGRVNPKGALGLFSIRREIRHTLAGKHYVDLDIENCHPVILLQICKKNKIDCKLLKDYVNNRNQYLEDVKKEYGVNRDSAKRLFIMLMYFGSFDKWVIDNKLKDAKCLKKIIKFKKELHEIGNTIMENNPEIVKLVQKSKEVKKERDYNLNASVVSYYLQEFEYRALKTMYNHCLKKGLIVNNDCVLCADGIMIKKQNYYPELLDEFTVAVKEDLDFDLVFTQKEMNQGYLEQIKEELQNQEAVKYEEIAEENKKNESEYLEIKKEVEKEYFFISDMGKFGKYDEEDRNLIMMNKETISLNLAPHRCHKLTKFGNVEIPFFDKWIADANRREYKNIVFNPQLDDTKYFNLFTGFELELKENTNKSTKNIHKVLNHVLGDYKQYVLEWFAYILKQKKKTNVAIVLYSDSHGVGKNSVIELFLKLMDSKYSTKIENIDDLASNFNSYLEGILFCYGDEVLAKNKDLYNFLKNTITRTQVKINRKGIDSYKCDDRTNYIFTTNDQQPFKIEQNDRRITMLQCNETKLDNKYFNRFYEDLDDVEIMTTFFNELIDMEIPHRIECLETEIKEDIQDIFTPSPIKYLYSNYTQLQNTKVSVEDLFNDIRAFEKHLGYTETKSKKYMTTKIKEIHDFTYKSGAKRGFKFENLENILQEWNPDKFADY